MRPAPRGRAPRHAFHRPTLDGAQAHREWLSLVEVSGPFLSLPVLRSVWPDLDPVDKPTREQLRREHGAWQTGLASDRAQARVAAQQSWIRYVLHDLLGWAETLRQAELEGLAVEGETPIAPDFALVEPGTSTDADSDEVKPGTVRLLGLTCPPGQAPTARIPGDGWAATPVDRLAHLCRHHDVPLGLATDGRFWTLLHAPRQGTTTTATFDAVAWQEAAERTVVRAFVSLLCRSRFFGVPDDETLVPLFKRSEEQGEELTEALGVQVRQAVELLVAAIGRADLHERNLGRPGLQDVDAHDVYRGAVAVMMRIVFLLFAEERLLLPADNDLYLSAYSAGHLRADLEDRVTKGTEEELEHGSGAWHRLLALFEAVHAGIDHPRLTIHPHAGSLFDPDQYAWLPSSIDDRTVLHMLRAVQRVQVGTGKSRETRTVSFRTLDVEQIGYVYEGLLAFEGFRADDVMVGLIGKEGLEEEVRLADLEAMAATHPTVPAWAAALADKYKDSRIGSAKALERLLQPLPEAEREEARKKLLAVSAGDYPLAERLLPIYRLIRRDLLGLPVIIPPGALYVTESRLRSSTGTHYTPQFLAREVVENALQPLVYSPGPLQTADTSQWKPRSSAEILDLKVADIAMGSAAFLVAAARYLGEYLVKAWIREGRERVAGYHVTGMEQLRDADADPVVIEARREIIEHCLYGVDINPMAVEMAKLSLWLVSMDPQRSFTFVDDKVIVGDSLLGVTSFDQIEALHLDPSEGRRLHQDALSLFDHTAGVREIVRQIGQRRQAIVELDQCLGDDDLTSQKEGLLAEARDHARNLTLVGDLVIGAALVSSRDEAWRRESAEGDGAKAKRLSHRDALYHRVGELSAQVIKGKVALPADGSSATGPQEAAEVAHGWLNADRPVGGFDRSPVHWPLEFPEVFVRGGFDAIVGNPPFLGGLKLKTALGDAYRDYLVELLGSGVRGTRGTGDLVAYFLLRVNDLLNSHGQAGILATNTLAQGDSRRVGLDQVVARGTAIRRSIKSRPWPSKSAVLEYCAVWISRAPGGPGIEFVADGRKVLGITPSLDPESRVSGNPKRLVSNSSMSFVGSNVLGLGFTLTPDEARALLAEDSRNADVVFPYLNGEDLNSRPDCSGSRWIVDFHEFPESRARSYVGPFEVLNRNVRPERIQNTYSKRARERWWLYEGPRLELYRTIAGLSRVIVMALVSKTVMPVFVPTGQVFSHKLGVFASEDPGMLGLLSSAVHYWWTVRRSSTMKADINYSPTDVFETLVLPQFTMELRDLGGRLDVMRSEIMRRRQLGLTKLYNRVFDAGIMDSDEVALREVHRLIDEAAVRAYGWDDLLADGLDHGFHPVGRENRYTIGPVARAELLDRLLELNHERYAIELAAGHHARGIRKRPAASAALAEAAAEGQLF